MVTAIPGRLWRYLAGQQCGAVFAALCVLLGLYVGIDLVGEVRDLRGDYDFVAALFYLFATAPARIYDLFPFAVVIGTTLMLARLAAGSEIVAMRACGFHRRRIIGAVLLLALAQALLVMQLGEWLAPELELQARIDREAARHGQLGRGNGQSLWVRDRDRIVHIGWLSWSDQAEDSIRFSDLRIYELDSAGRIERWLEAATAEHQPGRWLLDQVHAVVLDPTTPDRVRPTRVLPSVLDPDLFLTLATRPRLMSLKDLVRLRAWLEANDQSTTEFDQAFWRRLLYPLNLLAMVFAGAALMLSLGRTAPGGLGVFAGVTLGVGFLIVQRLVLGLAPVLSLPLVAIHSVPLILFAAIGAWLVRR